MITCRECVELLIDLVSGELSEEQGRSREAESQNGEAKSGRRATQLRQPEPGVQRRQQEEQREGIGADDEQGQCAECEQRGRVAC